MLAELAKLTALDEGSPQAFKVRAYENAIAGIESHPEELSGLTKAELTEIKGVGNSTADKILELEATGIEDIESLKAAVDAERLRELPGLGEKSEQKIARAIGRLGLHGKDRRTPLVEVLGFANSLARRIAEIDGVVEAVPCGSIRRFSETIGDVDIVVATKKPGLVGEAVLAYPEVTEVVGAGETKISFLTRVGLQVDIRTVRPDQLGSALLYFTGSKAHNIALRQKAIDRGLLLSEYGLFEDDEVVVSETEGEIYQALGMQVVPPMLREGSGEVEAASAGELPNLVERSDIKGDLHYHSDRSGDGRSSLEEMTEAAIAADWEYVAFTDHGEDLAINGSTPGQMLAHRDRIRDLDSRYPEISILFGCELNIGRDGGLDYHPDFRLEFDYCVASIHSHFDLSPDQQTARILTALQDPAVNAIGHLTGRYVGRRPGVELDVAVVLKALALTGVALEINGALDRLDATAEVARQATSAGVDIVIDTDSHHTGDLVRMDYGVRYAQRGWVTTDRVLNARPVDQVLARVAARRE